MSKLVPPFTEETARMKVKAVQNLWNERNPEKCAAAYTPAAVWRSRGSAVTGNEILDFLKKKFSHELEYTVRKELFSFSVNRLAVQFRYEYRDGTEASKGNTVWKRCYGLEQWIFAEDGRMEKGEMLGSDFIVHESELWFKDISNVDSVELLKDHW